MLYYIRIILLTDWTNCKMQMHYYFSQINEYKILFKLRVCSFEVFKMSQWLLVLSKYEILFTAKKTNIKLGEKKFFFTTEGKYKQKKYLLLVCKTS